MKRRTDATFGWNILSSDIKLLLYPLIRIAAMLVLLAIMWNMIFTISPMEVGQAMTDTANTLVDGTVEAGEDKMKGQGQNPQISAGENAEAKRTSSELSNVFQHMHFGMFLLFIIINLFIGIFSLGALMAQSLATIRGEKRSLGYGYAQAILRLPQLLIWWVLTIIVGAIIQAIESNDWIGMIVGAILGAAWAVLTFFSIAAIMATGCGPFRAITLSKDTVVGCVKMAFGKEANVNLKVLKRGLRIGGPLAIIQVLLFFGVIALGFFDFRSIHNGGHGVSMGAFAVLIAMMIITGAFTSAVWAVIKSTLYLWVHEQTVPEGVDENVLKEAFRPRVNDAASKGGSLLSLIS